MFISLMTDAAISFDSTVERLLSLTNSTDDGEATFAGEEK